MTTQKVRRKLAAILSGDVKGYGRLLSKDEKGTTRTLNTYKQFIESIVQKYGGSSIDAPGDNVLAEFSNVTDALQCAVEIQKELKNRNDKLPEPRRTEFRFGINLGEVSEKEGELFGDGINVAARIQLLADAGGVCLSGTAYEQVKNRPEFKCEYIGKQTVKNVADPIRIYRVLLEGQTSSFIVRWERIGLSYWKRIDPAIKVIVALIVAANAGWQFYARFINPHVDLTSKDKIVEVASIDKMAHPLPDKPSIAVLPFTNMSEDPKQEFLCDGMTEEIITVLSKVPRLFVVARNSTFTYKGKAVKVKQVSEELGVQYVLEGSVQKAGDRIRVTAQLIDALTGDHLWAERYERDLKDIFALQDEITLKILTGVRVKLTEGGEVSSSEKYYRGKKGLDCYLKIMEGNDYAERRNIKDNNLARQVAEEAIAMCPAVPTAYLLMANIHAIDYWIGSTKSPQGSVEKGIVMAQKALALDGNLAEAHGLLAFLYTQKREHDKGIAEGERAVTLSPGEATVLGNYAMSLNFGGRPEEAIPLLKKAIRLNPVGSPVIYQQLGNAFLYTERYDEAATAYRKAIQLAPNFQWHHAMLAASYGMMGREQEARTEVAEVLRINPKFSLDYFVKTTPQKDQAIKEKTINALRKAGFK
jgi:adenylate cyclase